MAPCKAAKRPSASAFGVGTSTAPSTRPARSTTPVAILVPPTSTASTRRPLIGTPSLTAPTPRDACARHYTGRRRACYKHTRAHAPERVTMIKRELCALIADAIARAQSDGALPAAALPEVTLEPPRR